MTRRHPSAAARTHCTPPASSAGHGRYALIGHHPKPTTAPMPPAIRPVPSHSHFSPRGHLGPPASPPAPAPAPAPAATTCAATGATTGAPCMR